MVKNTGAMVMILLWCTTFALRAEIPLGQGTVSARLESVQHFISYHTPLNPGNVFGADEGYGGRFRYAFGYAVNGERGSFTLNDYGSFHADDNPDGRNRFGELFASLRFGELFLDLGKKRINQSPSYFISPINFVLDDYHEYELTYSEGRVMLNLEWFSRAGFLGFSYLPRIDFPSPVERYVASSQDAQTLARYEVSGNAGALDLAVSHDDRWRIGCHVSRTFGQYTEGHLELVRDEDRKVQSVTGVTVNLLRVSIIAEYYYNGAGYSAAEWEAERDRLHLLADADPLPGMALYNLGMAYGSFVENRGNNGRHYAMIRVSNPSTDTWELSLTSCVNLQDLGTMLMPAVSYAGWDNLIMTTRFMYCPGSEWSEYALYGERWRGEISVELWF